MPSLTMVFMHSQKICVQRGITPSLPHTRAATTRQRQARRTVMALLYALYIGFVTA
jgi:hypothetical protein